MGFRTITIKNHCKLEYSIGYLCIYGEKNIKIPIGEINTLIIQSNQCVLTSYLISKLNENKTKVIFCDEKANPCCELSGFYNNYSNYSKIKKQISRNKDRCDKLWSAIIKEKISSEIKLLKRNEKTEFNKLESYIDEVEVGDSSNREGHAAKVYFNALFGNDFSRDNESEINIFLNYGYSIIVSCLNRYIKAAGYLTEIGIHHIGVTNPFNLTYDFFEPLRALVDSFVVLRKIDSTNYKTILTSILSINVKFNRKQMFLENAIQDYVNILINYLNGDLENISFIEYEF